MTVEQLQLPKREPPIFDRETPWKTAEWLVEENWIGGNRHCTKWGKFWCEVPDEHGAQSWVEIEKEEIRSSIYGAMNFAKADDGNGITVPFSPKKRDVDQVFDALKAYIFDDCNMIPDDPKLANLVPLP